MRVARLAAVLLTTLFPFCAPAAAEPALRCGHFTGEALPAAETHTHPYAQQRFTRVAADIKSQPYRVLFFGDSLTEGWPQPLWQQHLAPRGVFNAAVAGDSSENLRWRLDHGDLDGPAPQAVVVLIGTNDIGRNRSPELAAEGIRAVVTKIREGLPNAPILLLGLLPRGEWPGDTYRVAAAAVNRLIRTCADGNKIIFAEIGAPLLDQQGRLTKAMSPDALHLSPEGYAVLAPQLDQLLDRMLAKR